MLRTRQPVWRSRPGRLLVVTVIIAFVALAIASRAHCGELRLRAAAADTFFAILAIVAGYAFATEFTNLALARRTSRHV